MSTQENKTEKDSAQEQPVDEETSPESAQKRSSGHDDEDTMAHSPEESKTEDKDLKASSEQADMDGHDEDLQSASKPLEEESKPNQEAATSPVDPASESSETLAQLRKSLVDTQREASRLVLLNSEMEEQLSEAHWKVDDLEKKNTFLAASKEAIEIQLREEKTKRETAEENVEMLRGRLDEARSAVGTMRKGEDRRLSGLGFSSTIPEGFLSPEIGYQEEPTSRKAKRASSLFAQQGGVPTARKSSANIETADHTPASPNIGTPSLRGGLRELRLGANKDVPASPGVNASGTKDTATTPTVATNTGLLQAVELTPRDPNRRSQGEQSTSPITRASPPPARQDLADDPARRNVAERLSSLTSSSDLSTFSGDNQGSAPYHREHQYDQYVDLNQDDNIALTLKSEISLLKAQLTEAHEAREASEECLKVLREFIASMNGGSTGEEEANSSVQGIKLPPLPTDRDVGHEQHLRQQQERADSETRKSGWGFSLGGWGGGGATGQGQTPATQTTRDSRANSVAAPSVLSETAGHHHEPPSARSSVKNLPLETSSTVDSATSNPLSSFVASWSRGITGTSAATTGATGVGDAAGSNPSHTGSPMKDHATSPPATGSVAAESAPVKNFLSYFSSKSQPVESQTTPAEQVKREAEVVTRELEQGEQEARASPTTDKDQRDQIEPNGRHPDQRDDDNTETNPTRPDQYESVAL